MSALVILQNVPRTLDDYTDRIEHALRHLECCWQDDLWPGACNGSPVRFTLRVQRPEVTDGGFESYILSRTDLYDRLKLLSVRERQIVRVYSWMGPGGIYLPYLWRHYADRVGLSERELRRAARRCLERMARGPRVVKAAR